MWSIPPTYAWRWQCACYVSTWFSLLIYLTLKVTKIWALLWSLLTPALRVRVILRNVFIIQQESVEYAFIYSVMCDQCWECPLVKVWSLGLVPKYCCVTTACLLFHCVTNAAILPPSTTRQQAIFWHRCYCSYIFIPPVFHYLFAELVHLLGVLGTQETSCFVVAGLHERDIFDLFLPEFDKPWVIHLR